MKLKIKNRKEIVTVLDERLRDKKEIYLTGTTALNVLGIDWAPILVTSPLMVLGVNTEPLDELFDESSFVDCTKYFHEKDFLWWADKVFCANPVRAYVEWVYHCLRKGELVKGKYPQPPDDFLFTDEDIEEIEKCLEKLCCLLEKKGLKEKAEELKEWTSGLKSEAEPAEMHEEIKTENEETKADISSEDFSEEFPEDSTEDFEELLKDKRWKFNREEWKNYTIDEIAKIKLEALKQEVTARDLYDFAFILDSYFGELSMDTLKEISEFFKGKDLESWMEENEEKFEEDSRLGEAGLYKTYGRLIEGLAEVKFILEHKNRKKNL